MSGAWIVVVVAMWAFVVVLGVIVVGTLRRIAPILERAEASRSDVPSMIGLSIGRSAPDFTAEIVGGGSFRQVDLRGSTTVVLFISSSCTACEGLLGDLRNGTTPELGARLVTVVAEPEFAYAFEETPQVTVVLDRDRSVAGAFESNLVPQAFVLDDGAVVTASGRPNSWEDVRRLVAEAKGGERELDTAAL